MENPKTQPRKKPLLHEVEIVYKGPILEESKMVKSSLNVYELFKPLFDPMKIELKEFFYVLLLNRAHYCIGASQIGVGSTTGVMVNIKEIFQLALKSNASSIALCHNHPSGNRYPSEADKTITKKIKSACEHIEVNLIDHIIITSNNGYYSFADNGDL